MMTLGHTVEECKEGPEKKHYLFPVIPSRIEFILLQINLDVVSEGSGLPPQGQDPVTIDSNKAMRETAANIIPPALVEYVSN